MPQLFNNNSSALTATETAAGATQVVLVTTYGALFPDPEAGEWFIATLDDNLGNVEVIKVTSRNGDIFDVVQRDVEPNAVQPSPGTFPAGSVCELRLTAGSMDGFLQNANDQLLGPLDANGQQIIAPSITDGETVGTPSRGASGDTSNEFLVPPGGADPTIGGNAVWHAGNDGTGSGLDADQLDGQEGEFYTARANHTGDELPGADNTGSIGAIATRWATIYATAVTFTSGVINSLRLATGATINEFSTSTALGTSNTKVPTQNAVKQYVDGLFSASASANGFIDLPEGVTIQWGFDSSSGNNSNLSFPKAFGASPWSVVLTPLKNGTADASHTIESMTSTGVIFNSGSGTSGTWFIAIGPT